MPPFHVLRVAAVEPLTDDSAAVTFEVPGELSQVFAFAPGQSLVLRRGEERRSYSICAPAGRAPRIGVRRVDGGAVSGWLVGEVRAGDLVEVAPPTGSFTPELGVAGNHVLIAAGSGITPVLSIAASLLDGHDETTVTLLYGNRRADTVMFADEVADLKDAHPSRLRVLHVLSREQQDAEVLSGRLDGPKLRDLLTRAVAVDGVDHWWLCGPFGMVTEAIALLAELGVASDRIHRELFFVGDEPVPAARHEDAPTGPGAAVTVVLDGRSTEVTVPAGVTVFEGAQRARPDLPYACKGGVCGTCRARVTSGSVSMRRNYALEPREVEAGYVLTCQSDPTSPAVTVDFDA